MTGVKICGINDPAAFDTAVDLLMDALGALTAYALARYTLWRSA